jgi:hypothetical protein
MKASAYPKVFTAVSHLFADQGDLEMPVDMDLPTHMPSDDPEKPEEIDLPRMEAFLNTLTPEELETFCIGEEEEQKAIAQRNADGEYAHEVLEHIWSELFSGEKDD